MMIDWGHYVYGVGPLFHWGGGSETAAAAGGQLCYTVNILGRLSATANVQGRLSGTANIQGRLSGIADLPECD